MAKDMLRGLLIYSGSQKPSFFGKRGPRGVIKISCVNPEHMCFTGRWHSRLIVDDQTVNVCACALLLTMSDVRGV